MRALTKEEAQRRTFLVPMDGYGQATTCFKQKIMSMPKHVK